MTEKVEMGDGGGVTTMGVEDQLRSELKEERDEHRQCRNRLASSEIELRDARKALDEARRQTGEDAYRMSEMRHRIGSLEGYIERVRETDGLATGLPPLKPVYADAAEAVRPKHAIRMPDGQRVWSRGDY